MRKVYSHDKERGTTQQNLGDTERETVKIAMLQHSKLLLANVLAIQRTTRSAGSTA